MHPWKEKATPTSMGKSPRAEVGCRIGTRGWGLGLVAEFFSKPTEGEAVARAICRLRVDLLVA